MHCAVGYWKLAEKHLAILPQALRVTCTLMEMLWAMSVIRILQGLHSEPVRSSHVQPQGMVLLVVTCHMGCMCAGGTNVSVGQPSNPAPTSSYGRAFLLDPVMVYQLS